MAGIEEIQVVSGDSSFSYSTLPPSYDKTYHSFVNTDDATTSNDPQVQGGDKQPRASSDRSGSLQGSAGLQKRITPPNDPTSLSN